MDPVRPSSPSQAQGFSWQSFMAGRPTMAILLLLTLIVSIRPMLQLGYPIVHSIHFNMMWAFQYAEQFLGGQFYPRWLEGSYFGLGNPTFVFYPPLCMVALLPFSAFGASTSQALLGSMACAIGVRGLGAYRAARCLWPRPIALAVAMVAMVTPYFVVDVYERGAIAEVWSLCLIPWVLWGTWRILIQDQRHYRDWLLLAGLIALMGLTHLPGLLVWTLMWLIWPWCLGGSQIPLRNSVIKFYGITALGLGLATFFLLPAALDQQWVSIDAINGWDIYDPLQRFMIYVFGEAQWLTQQDYDRTLLSHFWVPLGIAGITLGIEQVPDLLQPPHPVYYHRILFYLVLITVISSLMMTDLSAPIYQVSPTLTRIQFPWRWMTITASTLPFFLGYLWQWVRRCSDLRLRWISGVIVFGLMMASIGQGVEIAQSGLYNPDLIHRFDQVMIQRPPFPEEPEIQPDQAEHFLGWHWAYPEGLTFVDAFEYRPITAAANPVPPRRTYDLVEWIEGSGVAQVQTWDYGQRSLHLETPQPATIAIRTFAYPGWQIQLADQVLPEPQVFRDGRIQIPLPPGKTQIQIRYRGTKAERLGSSISLTLGILMIGVLTWERICRFKTTSTGE